MGRRARPLQCDQPSRVAVSSRRQSLVCPLVCLHRPPAPPGFGWPSRVRHGCGTWAARSCRCGVSARPGRQRRCRARERARKRAGLSCAGHVRVELGPDRPQAGREHCTEDRARRQPRQAPAGALPGPSPPRLPSPVPAHQPKRAQPCAAAKAAAGRSPFRHGCHARPCRLLLNGPQAAAHGAKGWAPRRRPAGALLHQGEQLPLGSQQGLHACRAAAGAGVGVGGGA